MLNAAVGVSPGANRLACRYTGSHFYAHHAAPFIISTAGSTRCHEAVCKTGKQYDLVINIQGDEPLIDPQVIDAVVTALQDLREETIDVPPQNCFSKDEVQVEVDGVIYMSVSDPVKATYGVTDYRFAAMQLAQTTTRSVIGTLELDKTFEERDMISQAVVDTLNAAGETWGVHVHRYEIANIKPPATVQDAMEKQVTAERERRAILARAEGNKQSRINSSEGTMRELINLSEGERQRLINEAEGRAQETLALARATADSIERIGAAVTQPGGQEAIRLNLSQRYIEKLGLLAKEDTAVILPLDLSSLDKSLAQLGLKP
jgi:regulator of protease activity HflC (stomatin/prohibitin superfamily)